MFERTKALLDRFLDLKVPGYDIAIYKDGKCLMRRAGGYVDMEEKITHKGDELYNMYSSSKTVTCVAAMMLYERGLFKLEDELGSYLPEYGDMKVKTPDGVRPAKTRIKVEDLFQMTAGLNYGIRCKPVLRAIKETDGRAPTREIIRALAEEPLEFDPGTSWRYSLCHDVLACLVEVLSGVRFAKFVDDNIFRPVGMKNSTFHIPTEERERLCTQYRYSYETKEIERVTKGNIYDLGPDYDSGGASMVSTLDDFVLFGEALRKGEILKPETVTLLSTDRLGCGPRRDAFTLDDYGYGLGVRCPRGDGDPRGANMYDFGWSGAAGAHFGIDVIHGITVSHVQHVLNFPNYDAKRTMMRTLTADILDEEIGDRSAINESKEGITY